MHWSEGIGPFDEMPGMNWDQVRLLSSQSVSESVAMLVVAGSSPSCVSTVER